MSSKEVKFKLCKEDLRPMAATMVNLIIKRLSDKLNKNVSETGQALINDSNIEILEKLQKLVNDLQLSITEIQDTVDLIQHIKVESSADAEVLEDSLDLKKYSL
tara:strand:+ start:23 stop:334 length:312 start_codon:yes stop_codon:yes gene_type:complete